MTPSPSSLKYCARCVVVKLSIPPARARLSKAFLFAARKSIRLARSNTDRYGPSLRLSTIVCTAFAPTPLTAPIPKRTAPRSFTVNFLNDSFTSGPNTSSPIRLHSSIKKVTCLMSFMLFDSTAAIYSAG